MTHQQLLAAWLLFGSGFVACAVVLLICGCVAIAQEGRRGGARVGRSRPDAGCRDGACRRGDGSPRRVCSDEVVTQFLAGLITLDDVKDYYNRSK
jgi:hypothetical protein